MSRNESEFVELLEGKEKANRSLFTSYHALTIVTLILLIVTLCIGQFAWSLPKNVSCSIVSYDAQSATATIKSSSLPNGTDLKVKLNQKKPVQDNAWLAILGSMFRGSVNESTIVDAEKVTPNDDGTYLVSFESPYDSYTVSGVFYFGEPQGILDLMK